MVLVPRYHDPNSAPEQNESVLAISFVGACSGCKQAKMILGRGSSLRSEVLLFVGLAENDQGGK